MLEKKKKNKMMRLLPTTKTSQIHTIQLSTIVRWPPKMMVPLKRPNRMCKTTPLLEIKICSEAGEELCEYMLTVIQ